MEASQPRQPKGAPVGGQWTTNAHAEADTALTAPEPNDPPEALPIHDMPVHRLEEAIAAIDAANTRLEKAGIADRFTYEIETYLHTEQRASNTELGHEFGLLTISQERVRLTLSAPKIAYGGWTVVAALDQTEDGSFITRNAPGQELGGWRPDEQVCEHCGTRRRRQSTYLLRGPDGDLKQVGSSCLEPFLGVHPKGLWALDWDLDLKEGDDEEWAAAGPSARQSTVVPTRNLIAAALAVSDGGREYLSNTRAREWGKPSTTDRTLELFFGLPPRERKDHEARDETLARAQKYLEDGTADAVIAAARDIDGDTDYATNLRAASAGENTSTRHAGLVTSAISVWRRNQEMESRRRERAATPKGYVAPVGSKVKGLTGKVTTVRLLDNPYSYADIPDTLIVMTAPDGHVMKWKATGRHDVEPGQTLTFTGGTVKAHDVYRDVDQTVLTRVKYEVADPEPAVA